MATVFFKILPTNTQIRYFGSQISSFLVFHEPMHFDRFESADFKYDNMSYANYDAKKNS